MRTCLGVGTQPPDVPRHDGLKSDVAFFEAGKLRDPNHTKFRFVLAVLNGKPAAHLKFAMDESQPDARFGHIERMGQVAI